MKKLLLLSMAIGIVIGLQAQWQPDFRLTNNPRYDATCNSNTRAAAADTAGNVYVVWHAKLGSYYQIFFRQSSNGVWGTELQLTSTYSDKTQPNLAVDGSGNIHVVWTNLGTIRYKKFSGGRWLAEEQVSASQNYGEVKPAIAVDNSGKIIVVYETHRTAIAQIFCRVKVGTVWQPETRVSTNTFNNLNPTLTVDPAGNYHVAWDGNNQVFYRKYAGGAWQPQQQLTSGTDGFANPSIGCDPNNVHVVFMHANNDAQYLKWSGGAWSAPVTISGGSKNYYPSLACEPSGDCNVVYRSDRTTPRQIWYCKNQGGTWLPEAQLTNAPGDRYLPTIAFGNGTLNVIWQDYRDGNPEIYYKQYSGSADVAVVSIDDPTGDVKVGSTIQPKATVKNLSASAASFDVKCTIGSYSSTKTVTSLSKDATQQVIFDDWTAATAGSNTMFVKTLLAGDVNPANDSMTKTFNAVAVGENHKPVPTSYALGVVRPNPVATAANITFNLPVDSKVSLAIYDITGKLVRTLIAGERTAGYRTVAWDGTDDVGRTAPTGLYFIRFETPHYAATGKLVLTR